MAAPSKRPRSQSAPSTPRDRRSIPIQPRSEVTGLPSPKRQPLIGEYFKSQGLVSPTPTRPFRFTAAPERSSAGVGTAVGATVGAAVVSLVHTVLAPFSTPVANQTTPPSLAPAEILPDTLHDAPRAASRAKVPNKVRLFIARQQLLETDAEDIVRAVAAKYKRDISKRTARRKIGDQARQALVTAVHSGDAQRCRRKHTRGATQL
jgi:hypothetical protein